MANLLLDKAILDIFIVYIYIYNNLLNEIKII